MENKEESLSENNKEVEKGQYHLKVNPLGFLIPGGLISVGLIIFYFFSSTHYYQTIGLFFVVIGFFGIVGLTLPFLQLWRTRMRLNKQKEQIMMDRIEERASSKEKDNAE